MRIQKNNSGVGVINISLKAGRNFQNGYATGIANLCSQVAYNGSESYTKKQFIHLPMQYGGGINSGINNNYATFNIRGLDDKLPEMMRLLTSLIFEPAFNDIDKQKRIVKEITSNTMNDPFKVLLDRINSNFVDTKFHKLGLGESFNNITRDELIDFHATNYNMPAISISSGRNDDDIRAMVSAIMSKYPVRIHQDLMQIDDFDYYTQMNKFDEFKWNITTNNRMLLYFVVDDNPVYELLASIHQFRINKLIRMDKGICCRNRCITLAHGLTKRLFVVDVEFSDIKNKDKIINDVLSVINNGFTEKEFYIAKAQKLGNLMYDACDPVKACIFNSERELANNSDIDGYTRDIQDITYNDCITVKMTDYRYVLGTN